MKEDLFQAVWPDTVVSDAALTVCIRELRHVLGDNPKTPQYIETVHRRGYRFLPAITPQPVSRGQKAEGSQEVEGRRRKAESSRRQEEALSSLLPTADRLLPTVLVGREAELAQLHGWLAKALNGERQLVFVTGEAGIGKTALVDAFRQRLEAGDGRLVSSPQASSLQPLASPVSFAHGQCIEQFGAGEPYLPLLSALGQLGREPGHARLVEILSQYAPTWLVQMPALVPPAEFDLLLRKTAGATRERMLRELAEALEALTAEQPLMLVLEDLHWSDPSTLEVLSFLARRRQPAQLLVLGTYRPVDVLANGHPLRAVVQELQLHRHCEEEPLRLLSAEHIREYLAARLLVPSPARAGAGQGEGLSSFDLQQVAQLIHQRTEGNPLFMVNVTEEWLARGEFESEEIELSTPTTIRQMIERQFDHLDPVEQQVLEVASMAGTEFSTAAVAAGIDVETAEVEARCAGLARREHFLRVSGVSEWPDGTVAARHSFLHALYQEVLYERVPAGRRTHLHRRIGERLEAAYGPRAREIAVELAVHFERGRDYRKAVHYLQQAGENAMQRSANQEAVSLLTKGLELLKTLPDTPERVQQELTLQMTLGPALMAIKGYSAPEVEYVYNRARELCLQVGDLPQRFPVLSGVWTFYLMTAELRTVYELAEQFRRLALSASDPLGLVMAHEFLGISLFLLGDFPTAREHLRQSIALYDHLPDRTQAAVLYGEDPKVLCLSIMAQALWFLGYPDQALSRNAGALTLARELSHHLSSANALHWAAVVRLDRGEAAAAQELAEASISLSTECGFAQFLVTDTLTRGLALIDQGQEEEGLAQMQQGFAGLLGTGNEWGRPYILAQQAKEYGRAGKTEEGLTNLTEALALVNKRNERHWEAELYRLKGELLLQSSGQRLGPSVKTKQKTNGKKQKGKMTNP